jgi:hypothetical protein
MADFLATDYAVCQNSADWLDFLQLARSEVIRCIVFGDSQETNAPGGQGLTFMHALNVALARRIGNLPELPFCSSYEDSTQEVTGSLSRWPSASSRPAASVTGSAMPPGSLAWTKQLADSTADGNGLLCYLDAQLEIAAGSQFSGYVPFLNGLSLFSKSAIKAELTAYGRTDSSEVRWEFRPTDSYRVSFSEAVVSTSTTTTLAAAGYHRELTPALALGAKRAAQLRMYAATTGKTADLCGLRWIASDKPYGFVCDSASGGTYSANDDPSLLVTKGDCWPAIAAQGYKMAFITLGANDIYTFDRTPAQIKVNVQLLCDAIWANLGADVRIVLCSDPFRASTGLPQWATQWANHRLVPQAYAEMALADGRILALNTLRGTYEAGCCEAVEQVYSTVDRGAWATATAYAANDRVTYQGRSFLTNAAFTSSGVPVPGYNYRPCRVHLSDWVHETDAGAYKRSEVIADLLGIERAAQLAADQATVAASLAAQLPQLVSVTVLDQPATGTAVTEATAQTRETAAGVAADAAARADVQGNMAAVLDGRNVTAARMLKIDDLHTVKPDNKPTVNAGGASLVSNPTAGVSIDFEDGKVEIS